MNNKYIIFGSGGLAKELISYIEAEGKDEVVCVVSSEPFGDNRFGRKYAVVENIRVGAFPGAKFLLAVADPEVKRAIVEKNEMRWATYIHPTCTISPYATIGMGCVLAPQCIVTADAILCEWVFMNTHATVGHDSIVDSWTTMFPKTEICGDCEIGMGCILGIGSYVLPKKVLTRGIKVSAGAVVRHSFDQKHHVGITLQGNPAVPR